jgi:mono/diheme cytochrome c family protein
VAGRPFRFIVWFVFIAAARVGAAEPSVNFDKDIGPIFMRRCGSCHGAEKQRGGLRLDHKVDALRGGDTGPAIVPGKAAESLLVRLISGTDPDKVMPPKGERLTAAQVAAVRGWIDLGARWPNDGSAAMNSADWWSLKPLTKPVIPPSAGRDPIDAFILAKLTERGLTPAPEADRRTLIRRLYFDLIGLPPTLAEIAEFVEDPTPDAYEKLVDRLLASPHHGERWSRHWLDVVHFGETHGYDKDKPRPHAWPYRDYVIRALNTDKPYDRFVQEQVAGDVLFPDTVDGTEALGFLAAGPWDFIGHAELPESKIDGRIARHLDRDDFVSNTIGTFLSLTVHCAQCHNHKFDPITQEDYYSLQAVFAAIDRTDKVFDSDPTIAARRADLEGQRNALRLLVGPESPEQIVVRETVESKLRALPPPRVAYVGGIHQGSGNFTGTGASGGRPRAIHVLPRGDVTRPGKEVGPGAIAAVPGLAARFSLPPNHSEAERRAALARWLTDSKNPLVWRSIANRVWQHHFGRGIVDTPNDFGRMGQLPTHPELLDWLAADLRDNGGSLKTLHRLIVTSATYRQSSAVEPANARIDADNRFLWRQNRRKIDAEAVRDSILLVAGQLDPAMGGPSFQDFVVEKPEHSPHYEYQLHDPDDPAAHRRAIYRFVVRSKQQPFMAAFDCADPSLAVDKRNETITPQQALGMMNNQLVLVMAAHLAERATIRAGSVSDGVLYKTKTPSLARPARTDAAVSSAFRLAIGREPTAAERTALADYCLKHGLENTCRIILNLNEFAFVD